jgi:hypothetical protein
VNSYILPVYIHTQHSRTAFRTSPQFISLVRHDLVDALYENTMLPVQSIFKLSASIFVMLVAYFKTCLKKEIGECVGCSV